MERLTATRHENAGQARECLLRGVAVSGYCSFPYSREWAKDVAGEIPHDVWYSERNGDPITLIAPAGTPIDALPDSAQSYWIFEWIPPEGEFSR